MYKLIISDDEGKTTVVPLIRDEVTIGRKEGNTIRLTDRNISRFHARVLRQDDDFKIEDLDSLCGTKVNAKVIKAETQPISPGDKISIGDYSLSIRTDVATDVPMGKQMESGDEAGIGKVTSHARLVILTAPLPGKEIDLVADLYVLGRSSEANCQIKDSSISRAHARIDLVAGEWTISDLDSFNGIIVNGSKKDDYVLKAGDVIELGNVRVRFVAPGEPYDYDPASAEAQAMGSRAPVPVTPKKSSSKPNKMLLVLGVLAVTAVVVIVATMNLMGGDEVEKDDPETNTSIVENETFDGIMERGKDAMQSEEWAEAAKLFVLALRKDPNSKLAREFKELSVNESDSQKNFNSGLQAESSEDWKSAFELFTAIPRSSHYYDANQLKHISTKYCSYLIEQSKAAMEKEKWSLARKHLGLVDGIEEAPKECKDEASDLTAFIGALKLDAGPVVPQRPVRPPRPQTPTKQAPTKQAPSKAPSGFKAPINPYDS